MNKMNSFNERPTHFHEGQHELAELSVMDEIIDGDIAPDEWDASHLPDFTAD